MHAFDYAQALSVEHAVTLLAQAHGRARVLSGGTDLIVALREGKLETDLVVDVKRINEISALDYDPSEGLYIGASVPCHRIYNHTEIARGFAGLIDAAQLIGGVQVQGRASLGGNLCNASPAADSIPALIVHSAICDIAGPQGRRHVPVEDFCSAPGRTILQPGELLVALRIPAPQPGFGAAYLRFIPRNEMDIAVVGVGASVQLDESRTTITSARIALGAVAPTPLYVAEAGAALIGQAPSAEAIAHVLRTLPAPPPAQSATCAARQSIAATWWPCSRGGH
jgi:CO/xanthine dehydrogenase FAD-binding subunit